MASKRIDWDGPAEEYIEDAGEQPLWSYCRDMIEHGPKGTAAKLAETLGVAWNTMDSAIKRRARAESGEPVGATEPTPAPVVQTDTELEPEPVAPQAPPETVVYSNPLAGGVDAETLLSLPMEGAVVEEFLQVMQMTELFAGFALARKLDRQRAG